MRAYQRDSDELDRMSATDRALVPVRALHSRRAIDDVMTIVRDFRPDVVHVHNLNPLISPAVLRPLRDAGVPVVMTVHNYRLSCLNGLFFRDGQVCHDCAGKRFAASGVRHACYRGSRVQSGILATTLAAHRNDYAGIDRFLALSASVERFLRDLGIPASRIVVKPNTIADPGPPGPAGEGFLSAGRLTPEKGVLELVDAWCRHADGALGTLTIAGDGEQYDAVAARSAGRADIELVGRLSVEQVAERMRRAAVVVVPSRWSEAFPRVIAEALAHGRPVLTTDHGSLADIVGDAGWAVPATPEGLDAGLRAAAHADHDAMARTARRRFEEHYSEDAVYRTLLATYRDVAAR